MSLLSPQLQAFMAIVKAKTVHGAAESIHLTQTAVTQRIRALETKLKVTLFIRTRRGMELTPEGQALLHYCQAASELEGEALAGMQESGKTTSVRLTISGPTSVMESRVLPQIVPVLCKYPQLLLQFDIDDAASGLAKLREGSSQIAIVSVDRIVAEMKSKRLKPEQYVLVCCPKWRKRKLKDIIKQERIIDYDPADQISFNYLKQFGLFEFAQTERYFVNRTDALAQLLVKGVGYGLLTKEFARPFLKQGQLIQLNRGKIYENAIAMAWYSRPEPPSYFQALLDAIH